MSVLNETLWSPDEGILRTRLSGVLRLEDVETWREALERAAGQLAPSSRFAMLVDIRGYEVTEQRPEVHKLQREVIPAFLARRGFEVGFFRLFDVQNPYPLDPSIAQCVAVVHVHHDCAKMERYRESLETDRETFQCDLAEAERWLVTRVQPARLPAAS